MKKILFVFALLALSTICFGQSLLTKTTDTLKDQTIEVYLGAGKLTTATSGNAFLYKASYETSYTAGARWFVMKKLSFNFNFSRDTAHIGTWAVKHNFIDKAPVTDYLYSAYAFQAEWWPVKDAYLFVAPTYFTSSNKSVEGKWGIEGGVGIHHALYKSIFWQTELRFIHVQDFIVPVANAFNWGFSLGYRF